MNEEKQEKKKEKDARRSIIFQLSVESVAYINSVFLQSRHYTIIAILQRCKALGVRLQQGTDGEKQERQRHSINVPPDLLAYIQSIQVGALSATVATLIDTARRLNINPFAPLPPSAQPESLPETDGEKLPE